MKTIILIIFSFLLLYSLSGECQRKKKKKNSLIKQIYHNTTARYNGYFNAKLKLNASIQDLKQVHVDNYEEILALYPYIDAEEKQSILPNIDEIIKKTSMVINRHAISKWVDDCYLLLGKAYYLKEDYENALQTFSYISSEYKTKPEKRYKSKKKRKRKRKKAEKNNNFFKKLGLTHQSVYYDAILWLIHTYIETNDYEKAQTVIDLMKAEEQFPKKLKGELEILQTHLHLENNNKENAIQPLSDAIQLAKNRKKKTRYTYILAQLFQATDKNKDAIDNYTGVLALSPGYEMEFNAKINIAKSFEENEGLSLKDIKKQLKELARDEKNVDYLDQIYYILSELALKENNIEEAINYLKLSTQNSTTNQFQKALSFMKLADIYFQKQNYKPAKIYYDSTLAFLSKDDYNYDFIKERNEVLKKLVENFIIVEMQDSLQHLASLSPEERDAIIDNIIEQKRKEIERKNDEDKDVPNILPSNKQVNTLKNKRRTGEWYFNNLYVKSIGYNEFISKWGNRPIEDNWRRKNKNVNFTFDNDQKNKQETLSEVSQSDVLNRDYYNKNIPFTSKQLDQSNNKIQEALYKNGIIFKEELDYDKKSINTFEELNTRYPTNKYQLQSYYYLYLLYDKINDQNKSEYYKELILSNYPSSNFANAISNPNYIKESKEENKQLLAFYESSYELYHQDKYAPALHNSLLADSLYPNNYLSPKFHFLTALCYGRMQKYTLLKETLEDIIKQYPEHAIKEEAQRILSYLQNENYISYLYSEKTDIALYFYAPEETHYYIIVILNEKIDVNQLNINISNYNEKFYSLDKLQVSNILLNDERNLTLVKDFQDSKKALQYYTSIKKNNEMLPYLKSDDCKTFFVSISNFKTLYKKKNLEEYISFFEKFYLE